MLDDCCWQRVPTGTSTYTTLSGLNKCFWQDTKGLPSRPDGISKVPTCHTSLSPPAYAMHSMSLFSHLLQMLKRSRFPLHDPSNSQLRVRWSFSHHTVSPSMEPVPETAKTVFHLEGGLTSMESGSSKRDSIYVQSRAISINMRSAKMSWQVIGKTIMG